MKGLFRYLWIVLTIFLPLSLLSLKKTITQTPPVAGQIRSTKVTKEMILKELEKALTAKGIPCIMMLNTTKGTAVVHYSLEKQVNVTDTYDMKRNKLMTKKYTYKDKSLPTILIEHCAEK